MRRSIGEADVSPVMISRTWYLLEGRTLVDRWNDGSTDPLLRLPTMHQLRLEPIHLTPP